MKQYLILGLLLVVVSCNQKTKTKSTSTGNASAAAPYIWSDKIFPKSIQISNDFSAGEVTSISNMSTAWRAALQNKKTFFSYGARTTEISNNINDLDTYLDNVMGVYKTTSWPDALPGSALAVTQIFGRRYNEGTPDEFVNIEHADILVNYDDYEFDNASGYDLQTVVLHEMGHFLGLQHNTSVARAETVMYPSITADEVKRIPQTADISEMADKYGITISGSGSSQAVVAERSVSYLRKESDPGVAVKILIELHADGNCVHKVDGAVVQHHQAKIH